jgi:anti-sigma B factor antagonist
MYDVQVDTGAYDDICLVHVIGEADLATVPGFDEAMTEALSARCGAVLVDLSAATFIDSSMIAALIRWSREASLSEREALAIATGAADAAATRTLALVDVLERLPCFATVDAARDALREGAKPRPERALDKMTDPELAQAHAEAVNAASHADTALLREAARVRLGEIIREQQQRDPA